jgi:hypothetical protein
MNNYTEQNLWEPNCSLAGQISHLMEFEGLWLCSQALLDCGRNKHWYVHLSSCFLKMFQIKICSSWRDLYIYHDPCFCSMSRFWGNRWSSNWASCTGVVKFIPHLKYWQNIPNLIIFQSFRRCYLCTESILQTSGHLPIWVYFVHFVHWMHNSWKKWPALSLIFHHENLCWSVMRWNACYVLIAQNVLCAWKVFFLLCYWAVGTHCVRRSKAMRAMMHPATPLPFIRLVSPLSPFSLKLVTGGRNVTIG